jgi:hypothetical protein
MILTALVVATILTVVSLDLRQHVKVICQDWWIEHLQLMAQEDSTEKARHPKDTYLSHQTRRKMMTRATPIRIRDQKSTSSEEDNDGHKPVLLDNPDAMDFLTSEEEEEVEEEPNLAQTFRDKCTPSPRAHRYARCSKLHLALMFLLMAEANNALSTASHLPTFDDAAPLDAPKPFICLMRIRSF